MAGNVATQSQAVGSTLLVSEDNIVPFVEFQPASVTLDAPEHPPTNGGVAHVDSDHVGQAAESREPHSAVQHSSEVKPDNSPEAAPAVSHDLDKKPQAGADVTAASEVGCKLDGVKATVIAAEDIDKTFRSSCIGRFVRNQAKPAG